MTILCFRDGILAADRRTVSDTTCYETTKIWKHKKELLGIVGNLALGVSLVEWYKKGALSVGFPITAATDDAASLIVVTKNGQVWEYEGSYIPFQLEGKFCALGSGAEGGMIALAMGATAREAVEIVSRFNNGCGGGCDELAL